MSSSERSSLRRLLMERRDVTSDDLLKLSSKSIMRKLGSVQPYRDATCVGAYHSMGSEVHTQDLIQNLLSAGRVVCLPKIVEDSLEFRRIREFSDLEMGAFDIMEPKDSCDVVRSLDVILVPTVGVSLDGVRLGYGSGYYDRFLTEHAGDISIISLTLEKQIIRKIPRFTHDVLMDWIITEERVIKIQK